MGNNFVLFLQQKGLPKLDDIQLQQEELPKLNDGGLFTKHDPVSNLSNNVYVLPFQRLCVKLCT